MSDFHSLYEKYLSNFESYLLDYANTIKTHPSILGESILYSLTNGGKRIRPVLMLACADALSLEQSEVLPFALALEMIHTYSLIHDDLPCMDNDDFRRGKPSSHKQFGEANALLAGDALLNQAFDVCIQACLKGERYALAAKYVSECSGAYGMIAGQSADLLFSKREAIVSEEDLLYVYEHKTGKLILASVMIPSILAGHKHAIELENFGKKLGFLFQLTDDILDVTGTFENMGKTLGKDAEENKLTAIRLYGLEKAKLKAEACAKDCLAILEGVDGNTEFLKDFIDYILKRVN